MVKMTVRSLSLILALAALAPSASAAAHTLSIRFVTPQGSFSKTLSSDDGLMTNFNGVVNGRRLIFSPALSRADEGLRVEYQAELDRSQGRSIQVQGAVVLRPGTSVMLAECRGWSVELALDAAVGAKREAKGDWSGGVAANHRLTADISSRGARLRCRQIILLGSQANSSQTNIVDGQTRDNRKTGFILNIMNRQSGGAWDFDYQIMV